MFYMSYTWDLFYESKFSKFGLDQKKKKFSKFGLSMTQL